MCHPDGPGASLFNCSPSRFARKNYFYPDLPKAYQISQYELPLSEGGYVDVAVDGSRTRVGIRRVHLEEDTGKLVHAGIMEEAESSLVDYNRCGVPLMEIVSEPDIRTPEEAAEYLRTLRAILVYLEVCDGNMEEAESSLVDYNRCGVPLMEIVSDPDIRTPDEAAEYLRTLRAILVYLED